MRVLFLGGTGIISTASTKLAVAARHRPHPADARPPHRRPAGGRQDARPGYRQRGRGRSCPARRALGRRGGLDRLHPGADGARHRAVPRPHAAVHLHQLRQRLSEARGALPHHRVHAARQPVLGLFARQDRLRRAPDAGLPRGGLPHHDRASLADLRRNPGHPRDQQLDEIVHRGGPHAARPKGDRSGRRHIAVGDHAQYRFRQGTGGTAGPGAGHRARLPHHQRRGYVLGPVLRAWWPKPPARSRNWCTWLRISSPPACPKRAAASWATRPSAWSSTTARSSASCPDFCATVPFGQGIRRTIAWFDADPARRQIDAEANATLGQVDRRLRTRARARPCASFRR